MKIINVITESAGVMENVESFPIFEDQLSDDIIKEAEDLFEEAIRKNYRFSDDENPEEIIENAKQDGYFTDESNNYFTVYLIWSNVNM